MKKLFLLLSFLTAVMACKNSDYHYTDKETEQFLNQIANNAKASITDLTEIKNEPTNLFGIVTSYPLSKQKLEEYDKNNGTIKNSDDDISDFATYQFKKYELLNEKNQQLKLVDNGRAVYLQEYGLWDYNQIMHQNLGIELQLDQKFATLKGFILIEFEMPNGMQREAKIPVNISINDEISD